jgi:hypothetical protein
MHNVQMQVADDTLLICVGLRPAEEPVTSHIVASTRGNASVDGRPDLRVALVVYSKGPGK